MRPYQDWSRDAIRARRLAIPAEQDDLARARDSKKDATLSEGQLLDMRIELGKRQLALQGEDTDLRVELSIRDKPADEQDKYGGPGRD